MIAALGGLALLVRGLSILSVALGALLGGPARRVLTWATAGPWRSMLAGALVGTLTLNSSALGLTAIGLAEAGVASFGSALALGLAAKAGASVALLLAATPLSRLALPIVGIGFLISLPRRSKPYGEAILGLGLLLFGVTVMVQALLPVTESELFRLIRQSLESSPLGLWALGFALAALLGSANAVAAIALALAHSHALSGPAALALALGGGAGSGAIFILTNLNGTPRAQRIAVAHVSWKTVFSLPWLMLVGPISGLAASFASRIGLDASAGVALAHLAYHLLAALVALPILGILERLAGLVIPASGTEIAPKYLDERALGSSELAASLALREVGRIGDQLSKMLEDTVRIIRDGRGDASDIARREDKLDHLARVIVLYLSDYASRHEDESPLMLMMAASEIEHMGDQVRRILRVQNKLFAQNLEFSAEGRAELAQAAGRTLERLRLSLSALATRQHALSERVIAEREEVEHALLELRRSHLGRLQRNRVESRATTLAHLDLLIVLDEFDQGLTRLAALSQDLETPRQKPRVAIGSGLN